MDEYNLIKSQYDSLQEKYNSLINSNGMNQPNETEKENEIIKQYENEINDLKR